MYYSKNDYKTLVSYICNLYHNTSKSFSKKLMNICEQKQLELVCHANNPEINEQYFLAQVLHEVGIGYLQVDGIKNYINYGTFSKVAQETAVFMILNSKELKNRLYEMSIDSQKEWVYAWVEKADRKYKVHVYDKEYIVSSHKLKRLYLSNKKNKVNIYYICHCAGRDLYEQYLRKVSCGHMKG
ncbi:MAG TPA: hypothetical protein DCW90_14585 [Lachnospiraceae bacterium]|nr:hypothetical protein [uncultured Lachnoclostridium sp.]HAU86661.1 hypothetical protein [Lachnospiraceae bacterium]